MCEKNEIASIAFLLGDARHFLISPHTALIKLIVSPGFSSNKINKELQGDRFGTRNKTALLEYCLCEALFPILL